MDNNTINNNTNNAFVPSQPMQPSHKKSKTWWIAGIIVVLGVLAWWVYSARAPFSTPEGSPEAIIENLEAQGTSDEVSAIEKDLDATILEGLDAEISDIDKELQELGF